MSNDSIWFIITDSLPFQVITFIYLIPELDTPFLHGKWLQIRIFYHFLLTAKTPGENSSSIEATDLGSNLSPE